MKNQYTMELCELAGGIWLTNQHGGSLMVDHSGGLMDKLTKGQTT
jgi:hypothetical protein